MYSSSVSSTFYHTSSRHFQRTLDDIRDRCAARVFYRDRLARVNLSDSCHQVVRFVRLGHCIESVQLHRDVFVLVVRAALGASLRKVNLLQ